MTNGNISQLPAMCSIIMYTGINLLVGEYLFQFLIRSAKLVVVIKHQAGDNNQTYGYDQLFATNDATIFLFFFVSALRVKLVSGFILSLLTSHLWQLTKTCII